MFGGIARKSVSILLTREHFSCIFFLGFLPNIFEKGVYPGEHGSQMRGSKNAGLPAAASISGGFYANECILIRCSKPGEINIF